MEPEQDLVAAAAQQPTEDNGEGAGVDTGDEAVRAAADDTALPALAPDRAGTDDGLAPPFREPAS